MSNNIPTSRPRPLSEQWKTSSNDSWKTSSSSLNSNKSLETWKMSTKPRHAQLHTMEDPRTKRQSATPTMMNNSPWPSKPLPQEPIEPFNVILPPQTEGYAPFHLNKPVHSQYPPVHYSYDTYPALDYTPPMNQTIEHPPHMNHTVEYAPHMSYYPPPQINMETQEPPMNYYPSRVDKKDPPKPTEIKKKDKPEKKVRQITVQSINAEHRVWIDVLPSETGLSLAEKIHVIATFRTRKIVSITTASGRKIPLDNRPVFGSWMDMEDFVDGERWSVEWRENDRGVVDKLLSKMVQASGGKRKDHVAK